MSITRRNFVAAIVATLAMAGGAFYFQSQPAQADPVLSQSVTNTTKDWEKFFYQEAKECKNCHSAPIADRRASLDLCMLTEWSIWKTQDKHAQAYAVLKGERGRKISKLLTGKDDAVLKVETGCLGCHAMDGLPGQMKGKLDPEDGVSCGGCHGPSGGEGGWLGPHAQRTWRDKTPEEKYKMGMRNLRDPIIRAEQCLTCHVGSADDGRVVTHAMMAAGHPPLPPIEIATFSKNLPQHWRDAKDVPHIAKGGADVQKKYNVKDPKYQRTEFAVIGNIVAFRESLRLVRDRSNLEGNRKYFPELALAVEGQNTPKDRWIEIATAQSDCYSCHHDLRYPGYRQQRGFGYQVPGLDFRERLIPGRTMIRLWPLGGLSAGAAHAETKKLDSLKPLLTSLTKATNARPYGNPATLSSSANELIKWCDDVLLDLSKANINRAKAIELAKALTEPYLDPKLTPDYETARQISSTLLVICDELGVKVDALKSLQTELNLEPFQNRKDRGDILFEVVRDALKKPKAEDDFSKDLAKFKSYLTNFGDQATVEGLIGNRFLIDVFTTLGNKDFTEALIKPMVADQLQKLSDAEQKEVLKAVSEYKPKIFKAHLLEISKAIPKE